MGDPLTKERDVIYVYLICDVINRWCWRVPFLFFLFGKFPVVVADVTIRDGLRRGFKIYDDNIKMLDSFKITDGSRYLRS